MTRLIPTLSKRGVQHFLYRRYILTLRAHTLIELGVATHLTLTTNSQGEKLVLLPY